MTRILCVDPGKMTGWGFLDCWGTPAEAQHIGNVTEFRGGEMPHDEFIDYSAQLISNEMTALPWGNGEPVGSVDRVIVEGFTISTRTIQQAPTDAEMWSVKQIGVLETWCRWWPTPLTRQMPGAKEFGTDAKLKALGWWAPLPGVTGERGHRRDAARHALKYAVDHRLIDLRRLIA